MKNFGIVFMLLLCVFMIVSTMIFMYNGLYGQSLIPMVMSVVCGAIAFVNYKD